MNHLMIYRLDLRHRHAKPLGGRGLEHGARRGADLAHRHQIVPRAARSVGILVAEFDLVAGRLRDLYASPVGFHFLGDNQRQAGPDARSHFRTVCEDRDRSIGGDGNEDARVDHRAVRHLSGAGLIGGKSLT